jgi:hypothetical protein
MIHYVISSIKLEELSLKADSCSAGQIIRCRVRHPPVLSQFSPAPTVTFSFFNVRFNIILPSISKWVSLLFYVVITYPMHATVLAHHTIVVSNILIILLHVELWSSLVRSFLHSPSFHTFPSASRSEAPLLRVLFFMWRTKFHTHTNQLIMRTYVACILEVPVRISAWAAIIQTEHFNRFLNPCRWIPGRYLQLGHGHFLPHPFQFIIILLFDAT